MEELKYINPTKKKKMLLMFPLSYEKVGMFSER